MSNSLNYDETNLVAKVPELKDRLLEQEFRPDMIIGIARGGLVIAAHLSQEFGRERLIPVVSLWPHHQEFDNTLNRINIKGYFKSETGTGKTLKILIVDDICRSGHTLARARKYVEKSTGMPNFKIETAAISFYDHLYSQPIAPTFFVDKPRQEIPDALGEMELIEETPLVDAIMKVSVNESVPTWFPTVGVIFAAIALLFFMSLILLSLFGKEIPASSKFIVVAFLALGVGLSSTFLGGDAAARGAIPLPIFKESPMSFAVTGGIAVFVIVLVLGYVLYVM